MRFRTASCLAVASLVWASPGMAQEKPGTVVRIFEMVAKPGMDTQLEQGRKKHMEFHKKIKDTWTWSTWQVESGERAGTYLTGTFGHHWKDFDDWAKNEEADGADVATTMAPFIGGGGNSFWMLMPGVSRPPDSTTPSAFSEVIHFQLKQDGEETFVAAISKIHEAIGKTSWPVHYFWYSLANGAEGPAYVLVIPHKNWADMEEPDPSFPQMLEKAFGRHEAAGVFKALGTSVKSQWSELLRYRPDLSYLPAK